MSEEPNLSLEDVRRYLVAHRITHTDWAQWFELHPDDVRISAIGSAEFHRDVERRYTRMIAAVDRAMGLNV